MLNAIEIGNRIKEKQKEKNFKQKDIIEKTGISKAAISNYISGARVPDTESALKLSLVLETSIEWLLTGKTTNENFSEDEKEIIHCYKQATPAIQEAVRKLLDVPEKNEKSSDLKIG